MKNIYFYLYKHSRIILLITAGLLVTIFNPAFASYNNILNILKINSALTILASGLTLVVISGGIDLSIGSIMAITGCLAGYLMKQTELGVIGAILLALGLGLLIGLINGSLVVYVKLPPFVATFGMMWLLSGLANTIMRGQQFYLFPKSFVILREAYVPIIFFVIVFSVLTFLLSRTMYGRHLFAIGSNLKASKISGVPINRTIVIAYVISGFCATLGGLLFMARINQIDAGFGQANLLHAIAAVVLGGTSLLGGSGTVGGTFLGGIIFIMSLNIMNMFGVPSFWQQLVTGSIILLIILFDVQMEKLAAGRYFDLFAK